MKKVSLQDEEFWASLPRRIQEKLKRETFTQQIETDKKRRPIRVKSKLP